MRNNKKSLSGEAWERFKENKVSYYSLFLLILIILLCVFFTIVSHIDFNNLEGGNDIDIKKHEKTNVSYGANPPSILGLKNDKSLFHLFGTDELGRDLFYRTMVGGMISFAVSLTAVFFALLIGVTVGSISALLGGWKDAVIMRIIDILYSLPLIVFVILVSTMTKKPIDAYISDNKLSEYKSIINVVVLFVLIGSVTWLTMARIVRSQVFSIKNLEFIDACRIMGLPFYKILFKHILPNILGPIIVYSTLSVPSVMLTESTLSFLGLGVQAPLSSWGLLIKDGASKMDVYPWLLFFPALMFSVTLFILNFIGDGLRDALDPKNTTKNLV